MPNDRLNILFLPRWYPHRYDPMPGLFIQRQAEATSGYCDVAVLYVHADEQAANLYEIDFAEENGVRVVRVYYRESGTGVFKSFFKLFRFLYAHYLGLKVLRSFRPDLIHVHVLTREGMIAWGLKYFKGIPYVITEHWSRYLKENNAFRGFFRKLITRRVVRSASAMIAVSENLKSAMLRFGIENRNFRVVPNPVDTNLFLPGIQKPDKRLKRFIHISCFEDKPKNISGLLNAVAALSEKRSDFECVFIGDGPEFCLWKNRADQLGLMGKSVSFTGLKEQNELADEIRSADFMVLSSNYETFGTVVIESLACGVPVVATNVGIVQEVINESNGIIVPAGDQKALENAISEMLDTYSSYNPQVIRSSVLNKFDSETIANQLFEIYKNALNSNQNN
ncbi:MAG: glycosyltransferase [Bacteroidetes bacterium]|nr:glycosyltransferase [Bacteroidota bacterium]